MYVDMEKYASDFARAENKGKRKTLILIWGSFAALLLVTALLSSAVSGSITYFLDLAPWIIGGIAIIYSISWHSYKTKAESVPREFVDKGDRQVDSGVELSNFADPSQFEVKIIAMEEGIEQFEWIAAEVQHKGLKTFATIRGGGKEEINSRVVSQLREWDRKWVEAGGRKMSS